MVAITRTRRNKSNPLVFQGEIVEIQTPNKFTLNSILHIFRILKEKK